ncbi:MAG TPA: hypothetical protein VM532_15655 [Burkholderiales bacterium]|jgi:hypothetical protein|nr:hypothetical protein [Burkholderiales bacterium]
MPPFFRLLSEYFWLIALSFSAFNYRKARGAIATSQASKGAIYLQRFALCASLPWVVMGLGQILGFTPTIWHYFRPQDGNPFVIAWLAVILVLTCAYAWWVLFAGGAQKVRDLNLMAALGQHSSKPPSLLFVKLFAAFGPLFFPLWLYMVVSMNVPLPK